MAVELWVEKYRPKTLDEYVWRDPKQRTKVEEWLAEGALPHLGFFGVQGTGKTSLALLLMRLLGIPSGDIREVNATKQRKTDDLQEKIESFVGTWALNASGIKYIILNEADRMSPLAQDFLRDEMEKYSDVCRFILTANNPARITKPLHSRIQGFTFKTLDRDDFTSRLGEILVKENVEFEVEPLLEIVEITYPDLRKAINLAQQSVSGGVLHAPVEEDSTSTQDYLLEMANLFRAGRTLEARKLVVEHANADEYPDIFRFFYRNLDLWGDTEEQMDQALLVIRKGLYQHAFVADPEINLAATMVELCHVAKQ